MAFKLYKTAQILAAVQSTPFLTLHIWNDEYFLSIYQLSQSTFWTEGFSICLCL